MKKKLKIKDVFFDVNEIKLNLLYTDLSGFREPVKKNHIITPEDEAIFLIPCPIDDCISGGYDFTKIILEMVKTTQIKLTGNMACQGWEGIASIGNKHCPGEVFYTIEASYKNL